MTTQHTHRKCRSLGDVRHVIMIVTKFALFGLLALGWPTLYGIGGRRKEQRIVISSFS